MLKAVFSAIASALKSFGRMFGRIATAPFRMLDGVLGGGGPDVPPAPEVSAEADDVPRVAPDHKRLYEQLPLDVMQWCCDSLVAGEQASMPPKMPRSIAAWLNGLTRDECIALACADRISVSDHIRCYDLVAGVRSVQPLDRLEWPPEPGLAPDQGSGGFLSVLADAGTATWSAAGPAP
ncbi:hypothetical protein [Tardiphaga sp. 813_E8_N1_3]|uniref:hypothetical protein n=1 Tax=Tardiphaga sp. 813_E8_N1_3 TaxID=3240760 RepID=UPI003F21C6A7